MKLTVPHADSMLPRCRGYSARLESGFLRGQGAKQCAPRLMPPWHGGQKRAISDRFVTFFTYTHSFPLYTQR